MRATVLKDPALTKQAGRFVWLSIETERLTSAAFLERYPMDVWPTYFTIDPVTEKAELKWLGTATVAEIERWLDDGERAVHRAWAQGVGASQALEETLADADRREAAGQHADAARLYGELVDQAPADWSRRSRVVGSLVRALDEARDDSTCAQRAVALVPSLPLGPAFASAAALGLSCAVAAPPDAAWRKKALERLESLTRRGLDAPGLLADDRSGLYEQLAESRAAQSDQAGARALAGAWWDFLTGESARATSPEGRSALDSHRVEAALLLGDPARALPALERSEQELPNDYNAPARIAVLFRELGRYDDALAANARALSKVYGPRKLRVLLTEAQIYEKKGDVLAAKKAARDALDAAEALPPSQRPKALIQQLRARVGEALGRD
jgi:tetratricopeptide (TPR) repeat protein